MNAFVCSWIYCTYTDQRMEQYNNILSRYGKLTLFCTLLLLDCLLMTSHHVTWFCHWMNVCSVESTLFQSNTEAHVITTGYMRSHRLQEQKLQLIRELMKEKSYVKRFLSPSLWFDFRSGTFTLFHTIVW